MVLEFIEYLPEKSPERAPLLFIHGGSHGAWCWKENFLPYFSSNGYPSYALSLRGHGGSEGYENLHLFTISDYVNDILNVLSRFKEKPVLIGHSMGGALVQKILYLHSDKIRAAVLLSSVPPNGMLKDLLRLTFTDVCTMNQWASFNKGKRTRFPTKVFFSEELSNEKKNTYVKLLQSESTSARRELVRRVVPASFKTTVEILVLGSKGDWFFPEKTILSMGRFYKTKPIIFPGLCHDSMLDPNWNIVADEIIKFLSNLDS